MLGLEDRILAVIREKGLVEPGQSMLAGVSGGIDSVALLFLLHSIKKTVPFSLAVAHVNHMLRGSESERDETFVRDTAARLAIPFHVTRVDVRKEAELRGKSLQHAGRDVRYGYFDEVAEANGYDRIAIAHNRDDQVETFVLRVVKGTGVRGLSCIPIKRGRIIRPFLDIGRGEIEEYVREKGIDYVEDSSNRKDTYERNYVRHRILPAMEEVNPAARHRIMDLLGDLTALNERLDGEAETFLERYCSREARGMVLPLDEVRVSDEERRFRVFSRIVGRLVPGFIPLREHIKQIEKIVSSPRPGAYAVLPQGIRIYREYASLICTTTPPAPPIADTVTLRPGTNVLEPFGISIDIRETNLVPATFPSDRFTAYLDRETLSDLSVRTFRQGDRFVPLGMKNAVKVKDYFIGKKIPRDRRRAIPLLLSGDRIVWVIGERLDDRFRVTEGTTKTIVVTVRKLSTSSEK